MNRAKLRKGLRTLIDNAATPIFFIFTPDIVHFAPYCIAGDVENFEPILILNAVSDEDADWLRDIHPDRLTIQMKTSLSGNASSMLSHGDVLNDLFAVVKTPFCIQDPDCFVTNPDYWNSVTLDQQQVFSAGPFVKKTTGHNHVLPDTFFLYFNTDIYQSICEKYKITASGLQRLPKNAERKVRKLGYEVGDYPEDFKGYFDTLQAFWVLALSEGYEFNEIAGAGKDIFHIGGTSYLHNSDYDLAHWDYWPLSVIYFNLCLLELPAGERFKPRFQHLLDQYISPGELLETYPEFRDTWRFLEMQMILASIVAEANISQ